MKESTRQMCEIHFKDGSKHIYYWNGRIYRESTAVNPKQGSIYIHPSTTASYNTVDFSQSFCVSTSAITTIICLKEVTKSDSKARTKYLRGEKQTQSKEVPKKELKTISKEIKEKPTGNRWNYLEL